MRNTNAMFLVLISLPSKGGLPHTHFLGTTWHEVSAYPVRANSCPRARQFVQNACHKVGEVEAGSHEGASI